MLKDAIPVLKPREWSSGLPFPSDITSKEDRELFSCYRLPWYRRRVDPRNHWSFRAETHFGTWCIDAGPEIVDPNATQYRLHRPLVRIPGWAYHKDEIRGGLIRCLEAADVDYQQRIEAEQTLAQQAPDSCTRCGRPNKSKMATGCRDYFCPERE